MCFQIQLRTSSPLPNHRGHLTAAELLEHFFYLQYYLVVIIHISGLHVLASQLDCKFFKAHHLSASSLRHKLLYTLCIELTMDGWLSAGLNREGDRVDCKHLYWDINNQPLGGRMNSCDHCPISTNSLHCVSWLNNQELTSVLKNYHSPCFSQKWTVYSRI